jgi:signal transduction histidine kinase
VEPDESGVGLYTSKKMIELHGGTISVASIYNKGTTVTVVLPKGIVAKK